MSNPKVAEIRNKIMPVLREYQVQRLALFGSTARGEAGPTSDIDLLIELNPDLNLLGFIGLKLKLEEALGQPVDLVEYQVLKPSLRDKILREQVVLL